MNNTKRGRTFTEQFLTPGQTTPGYMHKIKETPYGYLVTKITPFVTIYKIHIYANSNGSAKVVVKVDQNYRSNYQYTVYFDVDGREIVTTPTHNYTEQREYRRINK